jgi:hypothetical protein
MVLALAKPKPAVAKLTTIVSSSQRGTIKDGFKQANLICLFSLWQFLSGKGNKFGLLVFLSSIKVDGSIQGEKCYHDDEALIGGSDCKKAQHSLSFIID